MCVDIDRVSREITPNDPLNFAAQFEPNDGELCIKCWQKTLAFHEFYIQIESVHEMINKSKLLELPSTSSYDSKTNPLAETVTIKCDVDYEDNDWTGFGDDVDNFSNSSMGECCSIGMCCRCLVSGEAASAYEHIQ